MICPECTREVSPDQGLCPVCDARILPDEPFDLEAGRTIIDGPAHEDTGTVFDLDSSDGTAILQEAPTLHQAQAGRTPLPAPDEGPLKPGQQFSQRYLIIELLGLGGMGAVYKAWDSELEVVVAIKVIRPEAAADPEMAAELDRRFKRELLLAREVTHPNVVRIHDLGEIEGIKYITMSFVDGEDLATILKHRHSLPIPEALRITRDVVAGLLAAHKAGVVHRDLKPANIMIAKESGDAVIMDFGIARSAGGPPAKPDAAVTQAGGKITQFTHAQTMVGAVVGTFEYMAPEQLKGADVDQRADLYTMGLILYDMLLGRPRIKSAHSAVSEAHHRSREAPPPLREENPDVPEPLDSVVSRSLEPDPEDRFQSTEELAEALDRLDDDGYLKPVKRTLTTRMMLVVATVVLGLLAGTWWLAVSRAPEVAPEPRSILIADFDNQTGDASFNGAAEQALSIAMEGAGFISAFPRASAQEIAEQLQPGSALDEKTARLVARREGIDMVLAGTLAEKGSGYRVSVRVLDTAAEEEDAKPLAKESETADSKQDVLAAVGRLAADLRGDLGDTEPASARLAAAETFTAASVEAMSAYARAQNLLFRGDFDEALSFYQEAVDLDPDFGRAHSGMGVVYANLKQFDKAEKSYQKALQQLERMTERERYRTLGLYYLQIARNNEKAIENYEMLVDRYPADRAAHGNLALAYLYVRDFDRAVEEGRQAVELAPQDLLQRTNYSMYLMYAGEYEESVNQARIVLEDNPNFGYALFTEGRSAVGAGDFEAARGTYQKLRQLGGFNAELADLGEADLEMYLGRYREAASILGTDLLDDPDSGVSAPRLLALGEALEALREPERARQSVKAATAASNHESILYPAARVLIVVGDTEDAESIALELENKLQSQTVAYARLIKGEIALSNNRLLPAVEALKDGWQRDDSWMAHYLLGRAYLEAEHYAEALGEFQICSDREGEALDIFLVDGSTIRYLPTAFYYMGRAQEGLGDGKAAATNYQRYLDLRGRPGSAPDPMVDDAGRRLEALALQAAS